MTLSERERFVFHLCTAMVLSIEKFAGKPFSIAAVQKLVLKNRARHLNEKDVKTLTEDMKEEVLLGGSCYEDMMNYFLNKPARSLDFEDGR